MGKWGGFLTERLVLKPGPNGWELYQRLVAEAYETAPTFDPSAASSFEAMGPFIETMFQQIQSRVRVEFVDDDPYGITHDEPDAAIVMRREVAKTGVLKIWKGGTQHPVFSPELNIKLRAVHDYMTHISGNHSLGTGFDWHGELKAYNMHTKTLTPKAWPALFTEVLGQASVFLTRGYFPEQKIAILQGFDFQNVGVVKGYNIVNKELVKNG